MATTTPAAEAPTGQHIFHAKHLTALALRWKDFTAQNRHPEAMEVLEEIIIGSTNMFERLAQYEGFPNTVDLDTLVQAAREKVPRWLCLAGSSKVLLEDGSLRTIKEIVDKRQEVRVLSFNEVTGQIESKQVTGWSSQPATKHDWKRLGIGFPGSKKRTYRTLYATSDHPIYQGKGVWTKAGDLTQGDDIYVHGSQLTSAGKSAIIGMFLGDGSVCCKGALHTGHAADQKDYLIDTATRFGQNYGYSISNRPGHQDAFTVCIPLMGVWSESCDNLPKGTPKKLTDWVISKIDTIALAYWFMDDGCYRPRPYAATTLHTESFTREDCQKLQDHLLSKFGIETRYQFRTNRRYGFLKFQKLSTKDKFFALIAPYVVPSMNYKLPEKFRSIRKLTPVFCETKLIRSTLMSVQGIVGRHTLGRAAKMDPKKKYDITVEDNHNFFAEGLLVHNCAWNPKLKADGGLFSWFSTCAKHAFLSELSKVTQHRKRFHATSDNLEKYYGKEDHTAIKDDAALEAKERLKDITARWGDQQSIGAVKFVLDSLVDERPQDRQAVIVTLCCAYGLSPEMGKFFYNWGLFALRDAMYDKIHVPFTQQDILRHKESYSHLVDLLDIIGWEPFKRLIATLGGTRFKLPTLVQLGRWHEDYLMTKEIERAGLDPASVSRVARRYKRTDKSAQEIFEEMAIIQDPDRSGEHYVYGQDESALE